MHYSGGKLEIHKTVDFRLFKFLSPFASSVLVSFVYDSNVN